MARTKKYERTPVILRADEIVKMFYQGYTIPMLIKKVKESEISSTIAAKRKVYETLYEYDMRKGWEKDETV